VHLLAMELNLAQKLNAVVQEKHLLKHPFYQLWDAGKLSKEELKKYSNQYYHLELNFPRYLSTIHCKTQDMSIRRELTRNLYEEEIESTPHVELWKDFQKSLGVKEEECENALKLPETEACISIIESICKEKSVEEGIAAMYAYEAMLPDVSQKKIEGLKKHYGISDSKALGFFLTHMEADAKHSNVWMNMLTKNNTGDTNKLEVAAHDTCQAMNLFLDGVMKAYVTEVKC